VNAKTAEGAARGDFFLPVEIARRNHCQEYPGTFRVKAGEKYDRKSKFLPKSVFFRL